MPVPAEAQRRFATEDPAAVIGELGVAGACGTCGRRRRPLRLDLRRRRRATWRSRVMATGGVYVGGGIVNKLLPAMTSGGFVRAFVAKGRYERLMSEIPVWIIHDPDAGLHGAAHVAAALAAG